MKNRFLHAAIKRVIDILFSIIFLVILNPVLLLMAILIKLDSSGPVIFKQKRVGGDGKIFVLYKFRTMGDGSEKLQKKYWHLNETDGPAFKIKNDPRLTKLGKRLRDTGIDELPQLLNVLKGEMSLVGPRPPLICEVKQYKKWQLKRLSIKPGITCLWFTRGGHKISFDNWVKSDIYYIENQSLSLDFYILSRTFMIFLKNLVRIRKQ